MPYIDIDEQLDHEAPLSHFFVLPNPGHPAPSTFTSYRDIQATVDQENLGPNGARAGYTYYYWASTSQVETDAQGGVTQLLSYEDSRSEHYSYSESSQYNNDFNGEIWRPIISGSQTVSKSVTIFQKHEWIESYFTTVVSEPVFFTVTSTTLEVTGGLDTTTTESVRLTKPTITGSQSTTTTYYETITTRGYSTGTRNVSVWTRVNTDSFIKNRSCFASIRRHSQQGLHSETYTSYATGRNDVHPNWGGSYTWSYSMSSTYNNSYQTGGDGDPVNFSGMGASYDPIRKSVSIYVNWDETFYYHSSPSGDVQNLLSLGPGQSTSFSFTYSKYHGQWAGLQQYGKEVALVVDNGCPPSSQSTTTAGSSSASTMTSSSIDGVSATFSSSVSTTASGTGSTGSTHPSVSTETTLNFAGATYSFWPEYTGNSKFDVFGKSTLNFLFFTTKRFEAQQIPWPLPIGYSCSSSITANGGLWTYQTYFDHKGKGRTIDITTFTHPEATDRSVLNQLLYYPGMYLFGSGRNGFVSPTADGFHTKAPQYSTWAADSSPVDDVTGLANNFVKVKLPSLVPVSSGGYTFSLEPANGAGSPPQSNTFVVNENYIRRIPMKGADMLSFTSSITEFIDQPRLFNGDSAAREYAACHGAAHRVSLVLKKVNSTGGYGNAQTVFSYSITKNKNNIVTTAVQGKEVYAAFLKRDLSDYLHPDLGNGFYGFVANSGWFNGLKNVQASWWMATPEVSPISWNLSNSSTHSLYIGIAPGGGGGGYGGGY